ncbi:MAG: hypothetical protein DI536_34290 [Archangium gephyra]|uniref:Uncharacterized protein n=1 Tax=Archangium gephyra TaxID=48 RepID=A0A2W5SMQ7_9BACT|nr:MAG: hypothetical protein DI536_34290 [Archangium gephyra]
MSDTQAAMREFRFLDEKRKTNGLTEAEESRWQELGAALGIDLSASLQPAGYYGADGLWYQYPPGYDPNAQWQQQYAQPGYAPQPGYYAPPQPQGYYDPNTGAYYPPQPQYAQPYQQQQPPPGYYDPNTGAYYPAEMYQQQPAYDPAPAGYDPNQQQWEGYQPQEPAPAAWPQTTAPQYAMPEPAPLPPEPQPSFEPLPELLSVDRSSSLEAAPEPAEEVGTDDVMEISDEEVMDVPVTAPPAPVASAAPAPKPSLQLDSVEDLQKALLDESASPPVRAPVASTPSDEFKFDLPVDDAPASFASAQINDAAARVAATPFQAPPVSAPVPSLPSFSIDEELADAPAVAAPEPTFSVGPVPAAAEALANIAAPEPELSVDVETATEIPAHVAPSFSFEPVPVAQASAEAAPSFESEPVAEASAEAAPSFESEPVAETPVEEASSFATQSVTEATVEVAPSFSFDSAPVAEAPVEVAPSFSFDSAPVEGAPSFSFDSASVGEAPVEGTPSFSFDSAPVAEAPVEVAPAFDAAPIAEQAPDEAPPSFSLDSTIEAAPLPAPAEPLPSFSFDAPPTAAAATATSSFEVDVAPEPAPLPPADPEPLPTRSSFAAAKPEFANELSDPSPPAPSYVVEPEPGTPVSRSSFAVAEAGYVPGNSGISLPPDAAPIPISMPPEPVFTEPPRPTVFSTQKFFADPGAALPRPPVELPTPEWTAPAPVAAPTTAWDAAPEEAPMLDGEVMPELEGEVLVERQPPPPPQGSSTSAFDLLAMPPESAPRIPSFARAAAPEPQRIDKSAFGAAWNNDAPDDFGGSSAEKVELSSNADFLASVDPQPVSNAAESIDIDAGEFVVESASAAELATNVRERGASSIDDGKLELASNHDFIDHSQLTQTGASWSNERESIPFEEEDDGEVIQGTVLEDEPEAPSVVVDNWGAAAVPPPPPAPSAPPIRTPSISNLPAVPAPVRAPSLSNMPAVSAPVAPPPVRAPSLSNMPAVSAPPPRASTVPSLPVVQAPPAPPAETSSVFLAGEHRVILHTMEGQVKRGAIRDAQLGGPMLQLTLANGGAETLGRERVKALFFMLAPGSRAPATEGNKVRVTFKDGRQVAGFSKDHKSSTAGFFVVPADNRTNTERIFIFRHAVQSITVEG